MYTHGSPSRLSAAVARAHLFPESAQPALKRWEVRVLAQIDLHTDDSFQFNKAAKVVREMAWVRDAQSV